MDGREFLASPDPHELGDHSARIDRHRKHAPASSQAGEIAERKAPDKKHEKRHSDDLGDDTVHDEVASPVGGDPIRIRWVVTDAKSYAVVHALAGREIVQGPLVIDAVCSAECDFQGTDGDERTRLALAAFSEMGLLHGHGRATKRKI